MNKCYLYYSFISIFVCASASVVFSCVYENIQGGLWAGAAGMVAGQCYYLHMLHFSNKLQNRFRANTMEYLNVISFVIVLVGSTFSVWYLFTMVYWKIPLFDYHITPVFPCVFSFITGKWGLHLFTATKEYSELLSCNYSPLVQP